MEFKRMKRAAKGFMLILIVLPWYAQAQEPPGMSKERREESQRLADDPQIQSAKEAWLQASQAAIQKHLRALAARNDARSLLAAAMLSNGFRPADSEEPATSGKPSPQTQAWFDAARRIRPRDALVAQVEANSCGQLSENCNVPEALAYLLQAEPRNAAVQLSAMTAAERGGDAAADTYWQAAAKADTYVPNLLAVSQLLHASMQGVEYPPLEPKLAHAMGVWWALQRPATPSDFADAGAIGMVAATSLPALGSLTRRCKPSAVEAAGGALRNQCEHVLALLAADQSNAISPMVGLSYMVQIKGDSEAGKSWRERLRQFYWVYENAMLCLIGTSGGPIPSEYGGWFMREGEIAAMRKLIAHFGLPAQAPAGWLPKEPRYRALVSTGKAPAGAQ